MSSVSKAEGQRKLSIILSEKRKKDPVGLLRAQRNGTLNEYLREDLAKYGLAVANVSITGGAAAVAAAASGGASGAIPAATKAPPASSSPTPSPGPTHRQASTAKPVTSSWRTDRSPPTPPPSASASAATLAPRPAPGRLAANRFESFRSGSRAGESKQAPKGDTVARVLQDGRQRGSVATGAPGTGSSAGVLGLESPQDQKLEDGKDTGASEAPVVLTCPTSSSSISTEVGASLTDFAEAQQDISEGPSVGGLAERFGGGLRVGGSRRANNPGRGGNPISTSASLTGGASSTKGESTGVESRSGGGSRIAELARRFEHKTPGAE